MPFAPLIEEPRRAVDSSPSGHWSEEAPGSVFVGKLRGNDHGGPETHNPASACQVLWRLVFRLLLPSAFATFSTQGFGTTFAALLALSATFCAVVGVMLREAMFGPVLTHWNEAAVYAVIGCLVSAVF
jgi:hypothetical protein